MYKLLLCGIVYGMVSIQQESQMPQVGYLSFSSISITASCLIAKFHESAAQPEKDLHSIGGLSWKDDLKFTERFT